jgi:hypothetical protein
MLGCHHVDVSTSPTRTPAQIRQWREPEGLTIARSGASRVMVLYGVMRGQNNHRNDHIY